MTLKIQEYRLKYTTSQLLLFSNTKPNINITVTQHRIRLPGAWDMPCTIEIDQTLVVHAQAPDSAVAGVVEGYLFG